MWVINMRYNFSDKELFLIFEHYEMLHNIADQFITLYDSNSEWILMGLKNVDQALLPYDGFVNDFEFAINKLIELKSSIPRLNEI